MGVKIAGNRYQNGIQWYKYLLVQTLYCCMQHLRCECDAYSIPMIDNVASMIDNIALLTSGN